MKRLSTTDDNRIERVSHDQMLQLLCLLTIIIEAFSWWMLEIWLSHTRVLGRVEEARRWWGWWDAPPSIGRWVQLSMPRGCDSLRFYIAIY